MRHAAVRLHKLAAADELALQLQADLDDLERVGERHGHTRRQRALTERCPVRGREMSPGTVQRTPRPCLPASRRPRRTWKMSSSGWPFVAALVAASVAAVAVAASSVAAIVVLVVVLQRLLWDDAPRAMP